MLLHLVPRIYCEAVRPRRRAGHGHIVLAPRFVPELKKATALREHFTVVFDAAGVQRQTGGETVKIDEPHHVRLRAGSGHDRTPDSQLLTNQN